MAIEYKEITQLEKLDTLADGSYIMVVQDGTAKLISKENAKFGGGSITTFDAVDSTATNSLENSMVAVQAAIFNPYVLQHPDGSEVTAQEAYDAYMAGAVRIRFVDDGEAFSDVIAMAWFDSSNASLDSSNVVFVAYELFINSSIKTIQIGASGAK